MPFLKQWYTILLIVVNCTAFLFQNWGCDIIIICHSQNLLCFIHFKLWINVQLFALRYFIFFKTHLNALFQLLLFQEKLIFSFLLVVLNFVLNNYLNYLALLLLKYSFIRCTTIFIIHFLILTEINLLILVFLGVWLTTSFPIFDRNLFEFLYGSISVIIQKWRWAVVFCHLLM